MCKAHTRMQSMILQGGFGGMPSENFKAFEIESEAQNCYG